MKDLGILPVLGGCVLLAGCGSVRPVIDPVASARTSEGGGYQIQIRYSRTTSGGPCFNGSSWFRSTTHSYADVIRLRSMTGAVGAEQMDVLSGPTGWYIKDLRGAITFTNRTMLVGLEQPDYDDKGVRRRYVPYYLNGVYQVTNVAAFGP